MKKKLLLFFTLFSVCCFSQEEKFTLKDFLSYDNLSIDILHTLGLDIGLGYTIPANKDFWGAIEVFAEPKIRLNNFFAVGFRMGASWHREYGFYENDEKSNVIITPLIGSKLLTMDCNLTRTSYRPFIGGGIGSYTINGHTYVDHEAHMLSNQGKTTNFGWMARVGVSHNWWKFSAEYNATGNHDNGENYNFIAAKFAIVFL